MDYLTVRAFNAQQVSLGLEVHYPARAAQLDAQIALLTMPLIPHQQIRQFVTLVPLTSDFQIKAAQLVLEEKYHQEVLPNVRHALPVVLIVTEVLASAAI